MSNSRTPRAAPGCAIVLGLCLGACSPSDEPGFERSIGAARRIEAKGTLPRLFASSAERFGLSTPGTADEAGFTYATPAGWSEVAPTEMRAVNFQIGEDGGTECYVTVLAGDGGGPLANVNRWCGQIRAEPWTRADLDAAARITMFGAKALIVELHGADGERALLGALTRLESRAVFVKLTGSLAGVRAQRAAFEAFCGSLAQKP